MIHIRSVDYVDDSICRVVLEDYTVLELDTFEVSKSGIDTGDDVDDDIMEELVFSSNCIKAQKEALKYLNSRMRTEKQIIKRLIEKGYSQEVALQTSENMRQVGYINDAAYARAYIDYRLAGSKKSWRMISYDLKLDGVDADVIEEVMEEYDVDEYARAAEVAELVLRGNYDERSIKRLNGILVRNGFGWDVINETLSTVVNDDDA